MLAVIPSSRCGWSLASRGPALRVTCSHARSHGITVIGDVMTAIADSSEALSDSCHRSVITQAVTAQ